MVRILTRADVDGLVSIDEVIAAVELAHADLSRRQAIQPAPATLAFDGAGPAFLPMAALAARQELAAVKLLADIPDNATRGLSVQRSVIVLVSKATGACEAIIDGQVPTRQRTAAASAVASRHLARTDSRVLGLVGAGNLAIEHASALAAVLPIERILVWSRSAATTARFVAAIASRQPDLDVEVVATPREVVADADVVCTLTPSREPVIHGEWFHPGLHLNAVGAPPRPDHREVDSSGMARARLFVDSRATAMKESGDVLLAIADGAIGAVDILGEIGDVIAGVLPGRDHDQDVTLFNSVGIALQDLAIGDLLLRRARATGVGLELDLPGSPSLQQILGAEAANGVS